uniref:HRDC domain-containing protein n=1 Tax=Nelumbo nucifera TaxID=4432 RepID=A0A822ZQ93_NELNU|nr:TPA_asm: hypothetical protein HUJ06_016994 [Nelumbo nucifera]
MQMGSEAMEMGMEKSSKKKAETLQALATGPLSSSIAKLSGSSRGIPSDKDFHFFYNFDEFKTPIREIAEKSESLLKSIGSSRSLWGKELIFPEDSEEAYDWLVNVSDEVLERCDVSMDEFQRLRKKEEESGRSMSSMNTDDGFQLVYGKKKKGVSRSMEKKEEHDSNPSTAVKVASRDKKTTGARPRVPFHIPTIPRPQDEFSILVNNSNQPFDHVWLRKSEDGSRFLHPLEELSERDFVDRKTGNVEPVKPLPLESTPFKLVEDVKDLKELAAKLREVNEFAVDLEHNQYRSFQGMTCLMQISTRMEDFVVDTLKLRVHIGPHLREIFKDPSKKKVMHGADRDIVWLQRDFGIYICNLFDTGQASRILQLERNSLEYLLHHFCGVTANKEYQNADWRLRPLPDEMIRYAREDTHFLLYIYDLMKARLFALSADSENGDALLLEVYKRGYDICLQLYEKELFTDTSYLYIYGLQGANFNAQQLAIVNGLCEWRDVVARAEDESTGYILPNKALLEIAREMPLTNGKLRRLVKSKHPYVERNLGTVVSIIRSSIQNAAAFEVVAEQLKKGRLEMVHEENTETVQNGTGTLSSGNLTSMQNASAQTEMINSNSGTGVNWKMNKYPVASLQVKEEPLELGGSVVECGRDEQRQHELLGETGKIENERGSCSSQLPNENPITLRHMDTGATIQVLKKPSCSFGALLGNSSSKRKLNQVQKNMAELKVEQIKLSVNLPFHTFSGGDEHSKSLTQESIKPLKSLDAEEAVARPPGVTDFEEIISLEIDSNDQEDCVSTEARNGLEHRENYSPEISVLDTDIGGKPMSLSDLSSSFQKCFQSINQSRNNREIQRSADSDGGLQLKPFDYAAARKHVTFGGDQKEETGMEGEGKNLHDSGGRNNTKATSSVPKEESNDSQQASVRFYS